MNIYRTEFFSKCPVNGIRVKYNLEIKTDKTIYVEAIIVALNNLNHKSHEQIADYLHQQFGGLQNIHADHHSVAIETVRGRLG
jgi:hypothetical protein